MSIATTPSLSILASLVMAASITNADSAQKRQRAPVTVTQAPLVDNVASLVYDGRGYAYNRLPAKDTTAALSMRGMVV